MPHFFQFDPSVSDAASIKEEFDVSVDELLYASQGDKASATHARTVKMLVLDFYIDSQLTCLNLLIPSTADNNIASC